MDRYEVYDHHQKRMDTLVNRFQKATALAIAMFLATPLTLMNDASEFREVRPYIGLVIMGAVVLLIGAFSQRTFRTCREIRCEYERDFIESFPGVTPPQLIGLFSLNLPYSPGWVNGLAGVA